MCIRDRAYGFRVAVLAMILGNIYGSPFSEGAIMGVFWALAGLMERYMSLRWQASQAASGAQNRHASARAGAGSASPRGLP